MTAVRSDVPGYRMVRLLGRGGMAEVWLAIQESLGREVALKLLLPSLAADPATAERFLREGRIAARLDHRNIVSVYDVGIHDGQPYLAIEYLPGGAIPTGAPHEPRVALEIVRQIALALDHAHHEGVIHRDIKPENILRRKDGTYALADFGIARTLDGNASSLTQEGVSIGTPHYMSPEQLQAQAVDARSDLYSLGVVLFQLLTGKLPYAGSDGVPVGMQHIHSPIPALPDALARYQTLIDALLAKQPGMRPQSGAELAQRIEAMQSGVQTAIPTQVTPTTRAARGGRRWRLTTAVAVMIAVLGYGGFQASRNATTTNDARTTGEAIHDAPAAVAERSVAVLPFATLGGPSDDTYFADGLTEETINTLAKLDDLRVIGRSSSFYYRNKDIDLRQIGRELGVTHLIEGSVRRSGDTLRVTAQLIAAADGSSVWSESFDRKDSDPFTIQTDIANAVAKQFELRLLVPEGEVETLDGLRQQEFLRLAAEAREAGLPGFDFARRSAMASGAIERLTAFVEAHPGFRPAYMRLGELLRVTAVDSRRLDPAAHERAIAGLHRLAERSRQRWPGSVEADALGLYPAVLQQMNSPGSRREQESVFLQLRELADRARNEPTLQRAVTGLALGRDDVVALRYAERFAALEPRDFGGMWRLSGLLMRTGDGDNARAMVRKAIDLAPSAGIGYGMMMRIARETGHYEELLEAAELGLRHSDQGLIAMNLESFYRSLRQDALAEQARTLAEPGDDWKTTMAVIDAARRSGYPAARAVLEAKGAAALRANRTLLADIALDAGDFAAALNLYAPEPGHYAGDWLMTAATDFDTNGREALGYAIALHRLGRVDEARDLFQRVLDGTARIFSQYPANAVYEQVVALAWLDRGDEAIAALKRAAASGWNGERYLIERFWSGRPDPAIEPLRERADFQGIIRDIRARNQADFERLKAGGRPLIPVIDTDASS
jgi:TolB-like protein/Flp pilus assembly protein TadD